MLEVAVAAFGVPVINNQMMVAFWQPVFEKKRTNQQSKLQRWNWVVTLTNHPVFDLHRYVFVAADHTAESRHTEFQFGDGSNIHNLKICY
jgi:hypothetical protein